MVLIAAVRSGAGGAVVSGTEPRQRSGPSPGSAPSPAPQSRPAGSSGCVRAAAASARARGGGFASTSWTLGTVCLTDCKVYLLWI